MQTENPKYSQILSAARNYCNLIEISSSETPDQFLFSVQGQMLELVILGRMLPEAQASEKDFEDLLKEEDYKKVLTQISTRCPFRYYTIVLDPFNFDASQEIGIGDIVDDLGDIYRDLKRSLLFYDSGSADAHLDALWEIKFSFDQHWAAHCIDGIKAIYDYLNRESE